MTLQHPQKFMTTGPNAKDFSIRITLQAYNPNPYDIWVDSSVVLRRHGRIPGHVPDWLQHTMVQWKGLEEKTEEVWYWYTPFNGRIIDFSQRYFEPRFRGVDIGGENFYGAWASEIPGEWEMRYGKAAVRYQPPQLAWPAGWGTGRKRFVVSGGVQSRYQSQKVLPAQQRTSYQSILTIPGPAASMGMRTFWDQQEKVSFDIDFQLIEFQYHQASEPVRDDPPQPSLGQAIQEFTIVEAIEINTEEPRRRVRSSPKALP